mmetsp:Transcript_47573/g.115902  ORF Transcript_47573/g.115902 Transcript_47573/m.115902 type:complete len:377 (-) Transcript_47573:160-1290(-)|eukprot:CAMPEP_0113468616 /NCGR_PEP_ID=MMETSP0014_2-20120614/15453_1 /TAXON_ID=2857 /ORGANISM="Nitzschia sp." /LENGTH=376 /DNA_ID=CAMNT_0000361023 /DNA_START=138 /DNA_END=1268 /DNA_ORIENTATION=+ /assembly_acc=CAM_ASM_000159
MATVENQNRDAPELIPSSCPHESKDRLFNFSGEKNKSINHLSHVWSCFVLLSLLNLLLGDTRIWLNRGVTIKQSNELHTDNSLLDPYEAKHTGYEWVGDEWVPPFGINRYSAKEISNLVSKHKILWIGDSSARQDYVTMYNIATAPDPNDILRTHLSRGINVNKNKIHENCTIRGTANGVPGQYSWNTGNHSVRPLIHLCRNMLNYSFFDLASAVVCHRDLVPFLDRTMNEVAELDYSVLIFSLGIWTGLGRCKKDADLDAVLEFLNQYTTKVVASRIEKGKSNGHEKLLILWKTPGATAASNTVVEFDKLQSEALEWFQENQPLRMGLVNFGHEVRERVTPPNRIEGDSFAHFGVSGRTLSIQMIVDKIVKHYAM